MKYLGQGIAITVISVLPPIGMTLIWGDKVGVFFRSGAFVTTFLLCTVAFNMISRKSKQKPDPQGEPPGNDAPP